MVDVKVGHFCAVQYGSDNWGLGIASDNEDHLPVRWTRDQAKRVIEWLNERWPKEQGTCETCKWWHGGASEWGRCQLVGIRGGRICTNDVRNDVETPHNFGCSLWEVDPLKNSGQCEQTTFTTQDIRDIVREELAIRWTAYQTDEEKHIRSLARDEIKLHIRDAVRGILETAFRECARDALRHL